MINIKFCTICILDNKKVHLYQNIDRNDASLHETKELFVIRLYAIKMYYQKSFIIAQYNREYSKELVFEEANSKHILKDKKLVSENINIAQQSRTTCGFLNKYEGITKALFI